MRRGVMEVLLGLVVACFLTACEDEVPPVVEQARPIRVFTVTEVATGNARKFSGTIEASDSSTLSFQVGGNVREVRVNQGDLNMIIAVDAGVVYFPVNGAIIRHLDENKQCFAVGRQ